MMAELVGGNQIQFTNEQVDAEITASLEVIHQKAIEFVKSWAKEAAPDTAGNSYAVPSESSQAHNFPSSDVDIWDYGSSTFVPPTDKLLELTVLQSLTYFFP